MTDFILNLLTSAPSTLVLGCLAAACLVFYPVARFIPFLAPYVPLSVLVFVLSVSLGGFNIGYRVRDDRAEIAILKSELAFKAHELNVQKSVSEFVQEEIKKIKVKSDELETKVNEYEDFIAKHPLPDACRATDDDVKRLRKIH